MSIQDTLSEREQQHGSFPTHCEIECRISEVIAAIGIEHMSDVQKVGFSMIIHKLSRILNNGHNHIDSWHDIAGYATLVEGHMREQVES